MKAYKTILMQTLGKKLGRGLVGSTVVLFLLAASGTLWAQLSTASVNGIAKDASGAVVPGVNVALQNLDTGVRQSTTTNGVGAYVILNIPPGKYVLSASKPGFQGSQQGVILSVNQTLTADFRLAVGSSVQTVNVEGSAMGMETSTAELGTVMTLHEVNNLPLNGRNFTQLLTLTPGASPANVAQNTAFAAVGSASFPAINGQRNRSNLFLLDGVNDQGSVLSTYAVPPILDDIQEFKVDSHNDQVQFGGVLGGVVNVVTKSGTNSFHGVLWEFIRNSALDARNPFFASVQQLRQNQFGANVGGPVLLPRYNGRNKTFFFASYEGFRSSSPEQTLGLIPTHPELEGDFSSLGRPIYNPFSTRPDPGHHGQYLRYPFPGGVIPASLLDPVMLRYAQAAYPTPVATGVAGANFAATTPQHLNQNQYSLRADQKLGIKDSLWFRFTNISMPNTALSPIGNTLSNHHYFAHNLGANWTHTFGPSAVLQAQFGRTLSTNLITKHMENGSADLAKSFDPHFTCGFQTSPSCLLPTVNITGILQIPGEYSGSQHETDIWMYQVNFSKLVNRHLFTLGFTVATNNIAEHTFLDGLGFDSFQTANLENPGKTGSALASFLLGVPTNANRSNRHGAEHGGWVDGFYFGDQWKVTDRLTLNAGIRWDVSLIPTWGKSDDRSDQVGSLDLEHGVYILQKATPFCYQVGVPPCIPGSTMPAHVVISPDGKIFHNDYRNVAPRLGIADRIGSKIVLHASAGIFYDNWESWTQTAQSDSGLWPTVINLRASNLNTNEPTVTAESPLSSDGAGALPAPTPFTQVAYYQDPRMDDPYSEQWNVGLEQQVSQNATLTLNYVGAHSSRLSLGDVGNTAAVPGPGPIADRQPIRYITPTNYDRSNGKSGYNALQASLRSRSSHGISYLLSYTWSKSMDLSCSGYSGVEGCAVQNPYNLKADYSVSAFDLTNMFSGSWVYQLPFGRGRRFFSGNGAAGYIIGGWQIDGILSLDTGPPYQVGVSGDIANTGNSGAAGYYERLNRIGNPKLTHPTPAGWFNRGAFAVPARYTFGNVGRNSMRADWNKNLDLSILREFPMVGDTRFEFRAEAFNVTNTPVWGAPVDNWNSLNFGRVLNTANSPRQLQMALKFYF